MEAPAAKPVRQAKASSATTSQPRRSRKRADAIRDFPSIMVRVDPELLARLDAVVERREAELRAQGGHTSRGAIAGIALREFVERDEARAAEASK